MRTQRGIERACWGPLPVSLPVQRRIKRAGLWAFLQVLREAMPPLTFYTDHLGILQGLAKGKKWCCSGRRPQADVWRLIWCRLEDLEYDFDNENASIKVQKVKAHVARKARDAMSASELSRVQGNEQADSYAREGADLDANFGRSQAYQQWTEKVQWAVKAVADLHVACGKDGWPDAEAGTVPPK